MWYGLRPSVTTALCQQAIFKNYSDSICLGNDVYDNCKVTIRFSNDAPHRYLASIEQLERTILTSDRIAHQVTMYQLEDRNYTYDNKIVKWGTNHLLFFRHPGNDKIQPIVIDKPWTHGIFGIVRIIYCDDIQAVIMYSDDLDRYQILVIDTRNGMSEFYLLNNPKSITLKAVLAIARLRGLWKEDIESIGPRKTIRPLSVHPSDDYGAELHFLYRKASKQQLGIVITEDQYLNKCYLFSIDYNMLPISRVKINTTCFNRDNDQLHIQTESEYIIIHVTSSHVVLRVPNTTLDTDLCSRNIFRCRDTLWFAGQHYVYQAERGDKLSITKYEKPSWLILQIRTYICKEFLYVRQNDIASVFSFEPDSNNFTMYFCYEDQFIQVKVNSPQSIKEYAGKDNVVVELYLNIWSGRTGSRFEDSILFIKCGSRLYFRLNYEDDENSYIATGYEMPREFYNTSERPKDHHSGRMIVYQTSANKPYALYVDISHHSSKLYYDMIIFDLQKRKVISNYSTRSSTIYPDVMSTSSISIHNDCHAILITTEIVIYVIEVVDDRIQQCIFFRPYTEYYDLRYKKYNIIHLKCTDMQTARTIQFVTKMKHDFTYLIEVYAKRDTIYLFKGLDHVIRWIGEPYIQNHAPELDYPKMYLTPKTASGKSGVVAYWMECTQLKTYWPAESFWQYLISNKKLIDE